MPKQIFSKLMLKMLFLGADFAHCSWFSKTGEKLKVVNIYCFLERDLYVFSMFSYEALLCLILSPFLDSIFSLIVNCILRIAKMY